MARHATCCLLTRLHACLILVSSVTFVVRNDFRSVNTNSYRKSCVRLAKTGRTVGVEGFYTVTVTRQWTMVKTLKQRSWMCSMCGVYGDVFPSGYQALYQQIGSLTSNQHSCLVSFGSGVYDSLDTSPGQTRGWITSES